MRSILHGHIGRRGALRVTTESLKDDQLPNVIVFAVCFCLLLAAVTLTPPDPVTHNVTLRNQHLPSLCTFKNLTGLPCPGCGLVRSVTALVHGDVAGSFVHHRLGWLIFALIFSQMIYRLILLTNMMRRAYADRIGGVLKYGIIIIAVLLVLNWIVLLIERAGGTAPLI